MQEFIIYQVKVAVLVAVFYMFFRLFLSKDTFHRFNRIVLLGTTLASAILPLCVITVNRQFHANPGLGQEMYSWMQLFSEADNTMQANRPEVYMAIWRLLRYNILPVIYIAGCAAVVLKTVISAISILQIIKEGEQSTLKNGNILILTKKNVSPFSWFRYIVINRDEYYSNCNSGMEQILLHEKAHIEMHHSYDVLFADMVSALQWFNPAIWMLKSDLRAIHEFEADDKVLSQGVNIKQYQYLLIKKAVGTSGYSIANSFNHSTLKNRITMMLQTKSSWKRALKALYIIPVAGMSLIANAQSKITVSEAASAGKVTEITGKLVSQDTSSAVKLRGKAKTVRLDKISNDNVLYIIDGKKQSKDSTETLDPNNIASIHVYKGEQAVSRYGEEAKNGAIVVSTKTDGQKVINKSENKTDNNVITLRISGNSNNAKANPLIIADGKEISNDEFKKIKPEEIESISVLKNSDSVKEYGEKGKDGVIQIKLKNK